MYEFWPHRCKFRFSPWTQETLLEQIKTKTSSSFDAQPPRLIRIWAATLSRTLLPIINQGISESSFPADLEKAEATPVSKKDDKMDKEKYRPVSVLPCFSKLYEYIMFDLQLIYCF